MATYDAWLEIRARTNFRTKEQERQVVEKLRSNAPALIERVASFRMFGETRGVKISSLRHFLAKPKKDRRKFDPASLATVKLQESSWSAAGVLPEDAARHLVEMEKRHSKMAGRHSPTDILDVIEACSPCIPAHTLRVDATPLGLQWEEVDKNQLATGPEIDNEALAVRLQVDLELSREEWQEIRS